nr:uncharacterized protein LOC113816351 [Penaeus vannamei]
MGTRIHEITVITKLSIPGKVLTHILLRRIRDNLLRHQNPEQSGFIPGKSRKDLILVLQIIVECRHEFELLTAFTDLKKALSMVHRESLWEIMRFRGIPIRIIGLLASLYTSIASDVNKATCSEDTEVTESFTYLDVVSIRIGLAARVMNSLDKSLWSCRCP